MALLTGQVLMVSEQVGECPCHLLARGLTGGENSLVSWDVPRLPSSGVLIWGTHSLFAGTNKDTWLSITYKPSPPRTRN